jgi:hypothetical protein
MEFVARRAVCHDVTEWLEALVPGRDFSHHMGRSARILRATASRQAVAGSRIAVLNAAKTRNILLYWYRNMSYPFDFKVVSVQKIAGQMPA